MNDDNYIEKAVLVECLTDNTNRTAADVRSYFVKGKGNLGTNYEFSMAELRYLPQTMTTLSGEDDVKNMNKLIDLLEDNDDIQNVYHNWEE